MPDIFSTRPDPTEYNAFYRGYVDHVPDVNVIDFMAHQMASTRHVLSQVAEHEAEFRYAPAKWSIKELTGHLCDTERVFSGRAMRFARNDSSELPGLEQDQYVAVAHFDERTLSDLSSELYHLRQANVHLFRSLSRDDLDRVGVASGWPVSVRALLYILAGHQEHHVQFLRSHYLPHVRREKEGAN